MRPNNDKFPTLVVESGWAESHPRLRADKELWLQGNTSVNIVILLKWSELSGGRVGGLLELWTRANNQAMLVIDRVGVFLLIVAYDLKLILTTR